MCRSPRCTTSHAYSQYSDDDSKGWGSGRPPSDRRWNDQGFENDFTSGKGQHPMGGGEYGSNPNWGRREINQGTPWDMPPPVNRPPPQGFHGDGMQPQNRFMPPNSFVQSIPWSSPLLFSGHGQWNDAVEIVDTDARTRPTAVGRYASTEWRLRRTDARVRPADQRSRG